MDDDRSESFPEGCLHHFCRNLRWPSSSKPFFNVTGLIVLGDPDVADVHILKSTNSCSLLSAMLGVEYTEACKL